MAAPISVLQVDDDATFAETAAAHLERIEPTIVVRVVGSADAALSHLDESPVDCIVSDYDMPETNGLDLLTAVRERDPRLPFILFTGKGSEDIASEAISAGVTDYVQKTGGSDQYAVVANRVVNAVERYRAEQEVERSEERLRQIIDLLPQLVFVKDEDGEYLLANESLAEAYGVTPADVEGETGEAFLPESEVKRFRADDRAVIESGSPKLIPEETLTDADGNERLFQTRKIPFEPSRTDKRAVLGVAEDITRRKERERELELFETMIESVPDGVYALGEDHRYLAVNDAMTDLTGYSRDEIVGSHISLLLDDEGVEAAERYREELRQGDLDAQEVPLELVDASGARIPTVVRFRTLPSDDGFVGTAGVVRDVSDQRARERELERQNERLEDFANIVSHDLQTPLTVANGYAELALESDDVGPIENVLEAHDRMQELIEDVLALARDGRTVDATEPVDVGELATTCWANLETDGAVLDIDRNFSLVADPGRLAQLVQNLLVNAVEHAGPGAAVRVGPLERGFYVEDDGTGIVPADREKIFEAGFTTGEEGVGLGLSIVYQIAAAHDWEIEVTESVDGGARFEITGVEPADATVDSDVSAP